MTFDLEQKIMKPELNEASLNNVLSFIAAIQSAVEKYRKECPNSDCYKLAMATILCIPVDDITPGVRKLAKTIMFALDYGSTPEKLSKILDNSLGEENKP